MLRSVANHVLTALLAVGLTASGCSSGGVRQEPDVAPTRGSLSSAVDLDHRRLPSARSEALITYGSANARDEPISVTGTVSVPTAPPPPGGWPVISWAHGTTGTADACAPSADRPGGPAHSYVGLVDQVLDRWVAAGYAVVQTDYEGLGTPGEHPYLNGASEANTVVDVVRAARRANPGIGPDWFAIGHSQGGQAALFAAAGQVRSEVSLRAAVAIAPGGFQVDRTAEFFRARAGTPEVTAALPFLSPLLLGAAAADPGIAADELAADDIRPLLEAGRSGCQDDVRRAAARMRPQRVFRDGAELGPLTAYLRSQDPSRLAVRVPTLVLQGTDDALVGEPGTDQLVGMLCRRSPQVGYRVYDGADHRQVLAESLPDAKRFVAAVRAGRPPAGACT